MLTSVKLAALYDKWDIAMYMLERWGAFAHPAQALYPLTLMESLFVSDSRLLGFCHAES